MYLAGLATLYVANVSLDEISRIHDSVEMSRWPNGPPPSPAWAAGATNETLGESIVLFIVMGFLGGGLTIVSPCILPVVPFVFARSDRPFLTNRLPLLVGLAATFALATGIGLAGLSGAAQISRYGRWVSLALLGLFGAALSFPTLAARFSGPFDRIGNRLFAWSNSEGGGRMPQVLSALLLGAATGMLWAPCAGPILGTIISGAALNGAHAQTAAALAAYAAGAATSLALVSLLQANMAGWLRRTARASELLRRAMGVVVLGSVGAIALGLDGVALARVPSASTNGVESKLLGLLAANDKATAARDATRPARAETPLSLPVEGGLPPLDGAVAWINGPALAANDLRGKVVIVNFWTYSCINCLRTLPYLKAWQSRYGRDGLVVVGVHTPEFGFEHDVANVKRAVGDLGVRYPVAIDNDYRVWKAFGNQYWPAFYVADAQGRIRYHHFGEGGYEQAEEVVRQLLAQANSAAPAADRAKVQASGALAAADPDDIGSGETYLGYREAAGFASNENVQPDTVLAYSIPHRLALNTWALSGAWNVGAQAAVSAQAQAQIAYRFHARDLHLVLAPPANGKPVRFRISIDGHAPGAAHGSDTTADGEGVVTAARLYQLVRQSGPVQDHTFTIQFLDTGVQAFTFTFG